MMTSKKVVTEQNKQSTIEPASKSGGEAAKQKEKSGKDAASHTKAGSDKGAGGGKKQQRNH
jgi:hypothetical protein